MRTTFAEVTRYNTEVVRGQKTEMRQRMKAWPPRLSRPRMAALLTLIIVGAGSAWWMFTGPPELHLRTIIEPPPKFQYQVAEIQGFSPDGSRLVVEHEPDADDSANTLILRHVSTGQIEKIIDPANLDGERADTPTDQFQGGRGAFHAFSPDGRLLAVGLDEGNVVKILETETVARRENTATRGAG